RTPPYIAAVDQFPLSKTLFGREKAAWLPDRLHGAAQFCWLVAREFGRNRCLEKSASLAFETLLHFVPVFVLSLFLVRSFGGLQNIGHEIPRYLLHQLKVDEIHMSIPVPAGPNRAAST